LNDKLLPCAPTGSGRADFDLAAHLRKASGGDIEAFAAFYDETSAGAYGLALQLASGEGDAQEFVLNAYVSMWRLAGSYRPAVCSPPVWVATFVRGHALAFRHPAP
jgi:RNA polymerase sigma-70 factor, ECF subfamily